MLTPAAKSERSRVCEEIDSSNHRAIGSPNRASTPTGTSTVSPVWSNPFDADTKE